MRSGSFFTRFARDWPLVHVLDDLHFLLECQGTETAGGGLQLGDGKP